MTNNYDQLTVDPRTYFGVEVGTCIAAALAFNHIGARCRQAKSGILYADLSFMALLAGATVATIFSSVADLAWVSIPTALMYFLSRRIGGARKDLNRTLAVIQEHRDDNLQFLKNTYGSNVDLMPELEALSLAAIWARQNNSTMPMRDFASVYRSVLSELDVRDGKKRPDLLLITS